MDAVFDLLRWPAGDFALRVDAANPDDVGIRLATETSSWPRRRQRQAAWDAVAAVIPSPDAVLAMPVVVAGEPTVTRDEWALLALVDGRRRVGDLVELTGSGQFAVVSTLAALVGRGLLHAATPQDHVALSAAAGPARPARGRRGPAASPEPAAAAGEPPSPTTRRRAPARRRPAGRRRRASSPRTRPPRTLVVEDGAGGRRRRAATTPSAASRDVADAPRRVRRSRGADVEAPPAPRELAPLLGRRARAGDVVPPRPEPFLPAVSPTTPKPRRPA